MISAERIPNNVNLSGNKRLLRALEHWQPKYIQWWRDMGPQGFQDYHQVYVRTAATDIVFGDSPELTGAAITATIGSTPNKKTTRQPNLPNARYTPEARKTPSGQPP